MPKKSFLSISISLVQFTNKEGDQFCGKICKLKGILNLQMILNVQRFRRCLCSSNIHDYLVAQRKKLPKVGNDIDFSAYLEKKKSILDFANKFHWQKFLSMLIRAFLWDLKWLPTKDRQPLFSKKKKKTQTLEANTSSIVSSYLYFSFLYFSFIKASTPSVLVQHNYNSFKMNWTKNKFKQLVWYRCKISRNTGIRPHSDKLHFIILTALPLSNNRSHGWLISSSVKLLVFLF